jgi:hypothetical protein
LPLLLLDEPGVTYDITALIYFLGIMFIFATSIIVLKQSNAFEGNDIFSNGKCAMIYKDPIIVQSFFIEAPKNNAKNMFTIIAVVIAPLALPEADSSNVVDTKILKL